jgi:hypothetical protein
MARTRAEIKKAEKPAKASSDFKHEKKTWPLKPALLKTAIVGGIAVSCSAIADQFSPRNTPWYNTYSAVSLLSTLGTFAAELFPTEFEFILRHISAAQFAFGIDAQTRGTLLHEFGHYLSMRYLFENIYPKIYIAPPFSDENSYTTTVVPVGYDDLSDAGKNLGLTQSKAIISAAGTAISMLWNYATLITAQSLPNKYSQIKTYLRWTVGIDVLYSVHNALAASNSSNCTARDDFCALDQYGVISPTKAAAFIFGSVFLLQTLLSCYAHFNTQNNEDHSDYPCTPYKISEQPLKKENHSKNKSNTNENPTVSASINKTSLGFSKKLGIFAKKDLGVKDSLSSTNSNRAMDCRHRCFV